MTHQASREGGAIGHLGCRGCGTPCGSGCIASKEDLTPCNARSTLSDDLQREEKGRCKDSEQRYHPASMLKQQAGRGLTSQEQKDSSSEYQ
jgi:hypothetical protein